MFNSNSKTLKKFIPVNTPLITKADVDAVNRTIKSGWISSEGKQVKQFEKKFF